jgi:2,4-dienoyl-CoA reductase-like NADH-dependent reductase (Old Yellow Enzyme family)
MNAGFDGVQIQANYLYLLAQFLNRDQPPDRMAAG